VPLLRVPPEAAGARLDAFLARHLGSRSAAQRRIEAGLVSVAGAVAGKNHRVRGGEEVEVAEQPQPPHTGDAAAVPYSIVHEDAALLIVEKPAGVVVHPAGPHRGATLSEALAARGAAGGEALRPGIVHRLDRDTSGLLVVAKSEEAHRRLKAALAAREIVREYLALVEGRPPSRTGTIDAPLGRDRHDRTRRSVDSDRPREARTHFETVEALADCTLVRVRLETGRTHQIRAHFQAIGHPVCGDREYGDAGRHGLQRQFLHAARLALAHPFSGERLDVSSPLPADLSSALEDARIQTPRG
jgi:23S rRNA pseudouridine1911/1915/1917 synthase